MTDSTIGALSAITFTTTSDYVPVVQAGVTRKADLPLLLGQRFLRPAMSGFTWFNQNAGSTATEYTNGDISLNLSRSTGQDVQGMYRTLPAASNFTVLACISEQIIDETQEFAGIFLCDANNQNILFFGVGHSTTYGVEKPCVGLMQFSDAVNFSSKPFMIGFPHTGMLWMKLKDDGTNRIFSISRDGYQWTKVTTQARSGLATTPSRAGFGAITTDPNQSGVECVVGCRSWTITTP